VTLVSVNKSTVAPFYWYFVCICYVTGCSHGGAYFNQAVSFVSITC